MAEQSVNDLVEKWFGGEFTLFDECTDEPELAWQAILEISKRDLTDEQRALLAGGPLETLLAWHGADFIDRVILEAQQTPRFNDLLGGVWRQKIPEEIWNRIVAARKHTF